MKKFENSVLVNSFTHNQLCIYPELKSQVSSVLLQISGFGGHSKFGHHFEISEIQKSIKGNRRPKLFDGPPKILRGTKNLLVFFKMTVMNILKKSVHV